MNEAKMDREMKHLVLDAAIDRVNELYFNANRIRLRIVGESEEAPISVTTSAPLSRPSLVSILDEGPDRLHKTIATVQQQLDEIESILF